MEKILKDFRDALLISLIVFIFLGVMVGFILSFFSTIVTLCKMIYGIWYMFVLVGIVYAWVEYDPNAG